MLKWFPTFTACFYRRLPVLLIETYFRTNCSCKNNYYFLLINHTIITTKRAKAVIANTEKIDLFTISIYFLIVGITDKIALISDYKLVWSGKYFPNQNTESSNVKLKMENELKVSFWFYVLTLYLLPL